MTIKLLTDRAPWKAGAIVSLDLATEAALVADKVATLDLTGGTLPPSADSTARRRDVQFDPARQALVDAQGLPLVRVDAPPAADLLRGTVEHLSSTAALGTALTVRFAPAGVYRKARISWVNNGASGAAKLYLTANCGNDVEGLVACQSAKQRDAELLMGGALLLVSPVPITSLNVSSDTAISADTHRLLISFGE